jgi:hypothetical protein
MICETCHGNTVLPIKRDGKIIGVRVCPDCLNGYQHCCEGADVDCATPKQEE